MPWFQLASLGESPPTLTFTGLSGSGQPCSRNPLLEPSPSFSEAEGAPEEAVGMD